MTKKIIYSVLFLISISTFSQQKDINNYKYVIVPTQFDFLSKPDQYQVNSLTKFLFNKNGFKVFLSNEKLPKDLTENRCLALMANVKNNSSMFSTKNKIELKDCYDNVVYTSLEGKSKNKDYKKAFHEAIRKAFNSLKTLNYKYNGKEITVVKETKTEESSAPSTQVEFPTKETKEPVKPIIKTDIKTLYAQEIENGFQLVNTKPEVVLQVLKSSKKEFYFIKNKSGVLFKKGSNWIAEFYENGKLIQKKYQIKF